MTSGGAAFEDRQRAVHAAAEVGHQHLDASWRARLAHRADAVDEVRAPPSRRSSRSTEVITTYDSRSAAMVRARFSGSSASSGSGGRGRRRRTGSAACTCRP
jgi:hypothetical protein